MDRHDEPTNLSSQSPGRASTPGRREDHRARHPEPRLPAPPRAPRSTPHFSSPATEVMCELLGPMRWLGAAKGSDLSEAWGGLPGDAGWMLKLPGDPANPQAPSGSLCITVSRRLGPLKEETRVVLFQELRGYGGLTWCLPADTPANLGRLRAEIESLLSDGATVVTSRRD